MTEKNIHSSIIFHFFWQERMQGFTEILIKVSIRLYFN